MLTSAVPTKNPSLFPNRFPENALGRSGRYTSILAFSDNGNEALLSLGKGLHALERFCRRELSSLWPFDL